MMTSTLPGVSSLFEVEIDFCRAKNLYIYLYFISSNSRLFVINSAVSLCFKEHTVPTLAQRRRGSCKVLDYVKHCQPRSMISSEYPWLSPRMHFLWRPCVSDPRGGIHDRLLLLQMFAAFTKWEEAVWILSSFGYHNMEPEGVYTAVTMVICLSTLCYVIKF